jgi:uncharacterized protein DUF4442
MTSEPVAATAAAAAHDTLERERRRLLNRVMFKAYLWARLPLAACAGLRVTRLDDAGCSVRLPGGWRTRNPFGSAYFAAQTMAAEMATGAPALLLVRTLAPSVALILREVRGGFSKRIQGPSLYTFDDVAGLRAVVERALASGESEAYTGRVRATNAAGEVASEFDITWSFKRRR